MGHSGHLVLSPKAAGAWRVLSDRDWLALRFGSPSGYCLESGLGWKDSWLAAALMQMSHKDNLFKEVLPDGKQQVHAGGRMG